ncbi:MAG: VirB4 family type IV secretion system protein [Flavonifractor plautii]
MAKAQKKRKKPVEKPAETYQPKDFLDLIAPAAVKFNTDSYVLGGLYRCVLALRGYPAVTEELALLSHICNRAGVTLHLYARQVTAAEEDAIYHKAVNKNRLDRSSQDNLKRSVTAEANLQDVAAIIAGARKNREPLIHCAVFLELAAKSPEELRRLRDEVGAELTRAKLSADPLLLRQREGFLSANPAGRNALGAQFERVLPASSTANLYPINYSGRSDPHGFYIGNDHYGSDILLDLDRRTPDKTNSSVLILGNSGEGKSYLLKLLLCNLLESGKTVICLDPEQELTWLCDKLGGCYADLMGGQYRINFLEAKRWDVDMAGAPIEAQRSGFDGERSRSGMSELPPPGGSEGYGACGDDRDDDPTVPNAFRQQSPLSQHISFLKDFFRAYKPFTHQQVDTLELMLERLYRKWGISDKTDFSAMGPEDWPIAEDLYAVLEDAYEHYDRENSPLYPRELLRELLLGLHSMCRGAESVYFNGRTNITSARFLVFGVKDLIHANSSVKDALLFNLLSYLSDQLLTKGNTVAALDELYLWLSNLTTIEYVRNCLKRVRKRNSALILASQNLEDFDIQGVRELTRPLFAIPTHQFLFHGGKVDKRFYMDNLQLESAEYDLISAPSSGVCLFKSGADRNLLDVHAPPHKHALITGGGG